MNKLATNNTEHIHQSKVVELCRLNVRQFPDLGKIFAIPNGGLRNTRVAVQLKREGVRPGVPDLCLPVPRGGYAGLWIEMKKPGNQSGTSKAQKTVIAELRNDGYAVYVCDSWKSAWNRILEYVQQRPTICR